MLFHLPDWLKPYLYVKSPATGPGTTPLHRLPAVLACLLLHTVLCPSITDACFDTANATCTGDVSRMQGGWWSGSAVIGGGCECQFDLSGIVNQSAPSSDNPGLEIGEYWSNCANHSSIQCETLGWLWAWEGSVCCPAIWYEQRYVSVGGPLPQTRWSTLNAAASTSCDTQQAGNCVELMVREEGVNSATPIPEGEGYLLDQEGAYIVQFIYLPTPVNTDWRGGWKISFDTMCDTEDETGTSQGACTTSEGGIKSQDGGGTLVLEIHCGKPTTGGPYGAMANFTVPPYESLQRFEAEFYLPQEVRPFGCTASDGTYMISVVLRLNNDREALLNEVSDGSVPGPNDWWRRFRIENMQLNAIVASDDQIKKGLADYFYLYSMEQAEGTELRPIAGFVESCMDSDDGLLNGLLYRTSAPVVEDDATPADDPTPAETPAPPEEPTPGPVCGHPDPWARASRLRRPESPPPDGPLPLGAIGDWAAVNEASTPTESDQLWARFAPLWHPWSGPPEYDANTVQVFLPKRPDLVLPWSVPSTQELMDADAALQWFKPASRKTRKWLAVRNDSPTELTTPAFYSWGLGTSVANGEISSRDRFPGWKIFEVIYMPVRVPSQEIMIPDDLSQLRTGAYQIRGLLVRECETDASHARVCEMPIPADTSRAYILELPASINDRSHVSFELVDRQSSRLLDHISSFEVVSLSPGLNADGSFIKPEMPIIPQWDIGPLPDNNDRAPDELDVYLSYLKQHDVTHVRAGVDKRMESFLPSYYDIRGDPFPAPPSAESPGDEVSLFLRLGQVAGMDVYDRSLFFEAHPMEVAISVKNESGSATCSEAMVLDGKRYGCPYEKGAVAVLEKTETTDSDAWAALNPGDYLACVEGRLTHFARVGATPSDYLLLDVPFPSGACTSATTFYRVAFIGGADIATLGTCNGIQDPETVNWIEQSELCSDTVDPECKPIACQDPMVSLPSNPFDGTTLTLICPSVFTNEVSGQRFEMNLEGEFRCWINPDRSDAQRSVMKAFIRDRIETWFAEGLLGPEPLLGMTWYDETKQWKSVAGEFDGFGMGEFPALLRFLALQCDGAGGLIPSCTAPALPNTWPEDTMRTFPPRAMNNPTKEALYYLNRTAALLDTDRDGDLDSSDLFPYCSNGATVGSCNQGLPLFSIDMIAASSHYADKTMAELIPGHSDEFVYDGPYTWAMWQPIANRMQGHLWRKVADENLRGSTLGDLSLPNVIVYPGELVRGELLGTWDTLPLGYSGFEATSDRQIPAFLTDAFGRYGDIDGKTWNFPIEALPLFSIPSQINDAYMAVITEADTSQMGLGMPYGPEYRIRNGSLAQGVCYAEELNLAYTNQVVYFDPFAQLLSYSDVVEACEATPNPDPDPTPGP